MYIYPSQYYPKATKVTKTTEREYDDSGRVVREVVTEVTEYPPAPPITWTNGGTINVSGSIGASKITSNIIE